MSTTYPPGTPTANPITGGLLDKSRTLAPRDYNRFLVPPAALAVHLSIGQVYAFSTFNLPLTKLLGITRSTSADWTLEQIGWTFSIAILFLGASAAVFGRWVESAGPRKAMFVAASCFGGGFLVGAVGIYLHQLWILFLGYGVLGGCGLGIGYISPVSTLIKWFPDRPGMATGMAIMGFGGGAMIAAPLSIFLMDHFKSSNRKRSARGVRGDGHHLFSVHVIGAFSVRIPPADWKPAGWNPSASSEETRHGRPSSRRHRVAHAAILAALGNPLHERHRRHRCSRPGLTDDPGDLHRPRLAGQAASFVGLLSLFNMGGRFFWASVSDYIGRRNTYFVFFLLGIALYASVPTLGHLGSIPVVRDRIRHHFVDVWRWIRDDPGILARPVWNDARRCDSRTTVDRLVDGGCAGTGTGQLYSQVPNRQRRAEGAGLFGHDVHHVRTVGRRSAVQPRCQSGRRTAPSSGHFVEDPA